MIHENILRYRGGRYTWWALGLIALSVVIYATQGGRQQPGGGTWQGYVLGTLGALLIVWLTLLGVRKRRYRSNLGSVQGWTSAHVWLGLALVLVATLHCAGRFGCMSTWPRRASSRPTATGGRVRRYLRSCSISIAKGASWPKCAIRA